ncbi:MAG: hypothetical protein LC772_08975 [Chloroflexi bacterium]|nr:hypothetical protein [Chloroflexota bacterium]
MDIDLYTEPLGASRDGGPVYLRDLWPSGREIGDVLEGCIDSEMFRKSYGEVYKGDERWNSLAVPGGDLYAWPESTYVKLPPYFEGMTREEPATVEDIRGARVLAMLGDSVTTDHISPAGNIRARSPAGEYLIAHGVEPRDFNQYGARRGNHEVMVRGTFANVRLRNQLAPGTEGWFTTYPPGGEVMTIYDASMAYQKESIPLIVLAGKEYGSGSSRDWAAKGPKLLGVHAVIAQSYERIHRSNLIGMGILPLQFLAEESPAALGLTGQETYDIIGLSEGIRNGFAGGRTVQVRAAKADGTHRDFTATVRIDTDQEILYFRHGGILQYVLRQLLSDRRRAA